MALAHIAADRPAPRVPRMAYSCREVEMIGMGSCCSVVDTNEPSRPKYIGEK